MPLSPIQGICPDPSIKMSLFLRKTCFVGSSRELTKTSFDEYNLYFGYLINSILLEFLASGLWGFSK
jgi:hypothetical protein